MWAMANLIAHEGQVAPDALPSKDGVIITEDGVLEKDRSQVDKALTQVIGWKEAEEVHELSGKLLCIGYGRHDEIANHAAEPSHEVETLELRRVGKTRRRKVPLDRIGCAFVCVRACVFARV